jgi:hypothetical protein
LRKSHIDRERIYALIKEKLRENGKKYSGTYRTAIDNVLDIIDDEFLENRKDELIRFQINQEARSRFLNDREERIKKDCEKLAKEKEGLEELRKEIECMGKSIEELKDDRAINAIKFAKTIGDLFKQYPDNIVTAMSYAVWAYLGGDKNLEVEKP